MIGRASLARRAAIGSPYATIFLLAAGVRVLTVPGRGGGYGGTFDYDSGVYYAAADALVHGRLPYRDFTLVHPPGSMLVLTPFAWIGSITTDKTGYVLANLAFTALAGGAAVLAARIVRELVPSRLAMWTTGVFYAVYPGAVGVERASRLEPLANFLLLLGVLYMIRAGRSRWWASALGGAALAIAVSVKIWYVVPAAVVLLGYLGATRCRGLVAALGGATSAALLVNGPFFVLAPRAMYHRVIVDQLSRPTRTTAGVRTRLADVSGAPPLNFPNALSHHAQVVAAATVAAVLVSIMVTSALRPGGLIPAAMLLAQVVVFLTSSSYFDFYVDYLTPAIGVCLGITAGAVFTATASRIARRVAKPARAAGLVLLAGISVLFLGLSLASTAQVTQPYPSTQFARAAADSRCIMSNTPNVLIQLDALSRGLANGCRNWIDFNGRLLGPDRFHIGPGKRVDKRKWQRDHARYLLSGDAVALLNGQTFGMSLRLIDILGNAPLIARSGNLCIVRITDTQREQLRNKTRLPSTIPAGSAGVPFAVTTPWCPKPANR